MDRRVLQHVAGQDVAHAEVRGANGQVGVGVELREDGERGAVRRNDRAAKEVVVRQGERDGPLRTTGVGRRELRWAGGRAGGQRPARTFGAPMCVDVGVNWPDGSAGRIVCSLLSWSAVNTSTCVTAPGEVPRLRWPIEPTYACSKVFPETRERGSILYRPFRRILAESPGKAHDPSGAHGSDPASFAEP